MNSANLKVVASYHVRVTHVAETLNFFECEFLHLPRIEEIRAAIQKRIIELTPTKDTSLADEKQIGNLDALLSVLALASRPVNPGILSPGEYTFEIARVRIGTIRVIERKITVTRNDAGFIESLFPTASPTGPTGPTGPIRQNTGHGDLCQCIPCCNLREAFPSQQFNPDHVHAGGYAAVDAQGNGLEPLEGE